MFYSIYISIYIYIYIYIYRKAVWYYELLTHNYFYKLVKRAFLSPAYSNIPSRLHSNQGAKFCSKIITELCKITGISKSRTTPYHPNGITERFDRTIISMLGTLDPEQKHN